MQKNSITMPIDPNYLPLTTSHFLPPEASISSEVPLSGNLGSHIVDVMVSHNGLAEWSAAAMHARSTSAAVDTTMQQPVAALRNSPPNLRHSLVHAAGALFQQVRTASAAANEGRDLRRRDGCNDTAKVSELSAGMCESSDIVCRQRRSAILYVRSSLHAGPEELKPYAASGKCLQALQRIRMLEQENLHLQAEIQIWKLRLEQARLRCDSGDHVAAGTAE
jgi:hypothetical protein